MLPAIVVSVLRQLKQPEPRLWFDRPFLQRILFKQDMDGCRIAINHPDLYSVGVSVGFLFGRGYTPNCIEGTLGYRVVIAGLTLELHVRDKVRVTKFDNVDYDPQTQKLTYHAGELSEDATQKFQKKISELLFDPYANVKEEVWQERQLALLPYINDGWTLLDRCGDQVEFVEPGNEDGSPNPRVKWAVYNSTAKKALEQKRNDHRDFINFRKELAELLAKYGMTPK